MKKVLFLMLFLLLLGAASVKAQVRIGGNAVPQGAAVLDLNADNTATPTANKGALALPRVSLASATAQLNGTTPITGMLVYNTNATLGVGIYFWNGSNWIIISGDGIVGNEVTNATTGGGLVRAGLGTTASPYTLGLATAGAKNGATMQFNGSTWNVVNNDTCGWVSMFLPTLGYNAPVGTFVTASLQDSATVQGFGTVDIAGPRVVRVRGNYPGMVNLNMYGNNIVYVLVTRSGWQTTVANIEIYTCFYR